MAKQEIDIGVEGNDGTGDSIRESFKKVNENFSELFAVFGLGGTISFKALDDTPAVYTGNESSVPLVNTEATGIGFYRFVSDSGANNNSVSNPSNLTNSVFFTFVDADPTTPNDSGTVKIVINDPHIERDPDPRILNPLSVEAPAAYSNAQNTVLRNTTGVGDSITTMVDQWNTIHDNLPQIDSDNIIISKGYADDTYLNADGDELTGLLSYDTGVGPASGREIPAMEDVIARNGSLENRTMLQDLFATDHPKPLQGAGTPNGDDDLQFVTKLYVDTQGYASPTNLFVSTAGDDSQKFTPAGQEGRSLNYSYKTINAAMQRAERIIESTPFEPGPYVQTITHTNNKFKSVVDNVAGVGSPPGTAPAARNIVLDKLTQISYDTTDYINTNFPDLEYDEVICRRDTKLILQSIALDVEAGANANYLTRWAGFRYNANPSGIIAQTIQLTETIAGIRKAQQLLDAEFVANGTITSTVRGYYGDRFDEIVSLIQNQEELDVNLVYGNSYTFAFTNGGQSAVDQGVAGNPDLRAGKLIVGKQSGAKGIITAYNRAATGTTDSITVQLIEPFDFAVGEEMEFGSIVRNNQVTVFVESGIYEEQLPIKLPENVSIKGDEFRRTVVRPAKGTSLSKYANTYFYRDIVFDGLPAADSPLATITNQSGADSNRTPGTYQIAANDYATTGIGQDATFTIVVNGSGAATVSVGNGGNGFVIGETITIDDDDMGSGGGAALTFDVATTGGGYHFTHPQASIQGKYGYHYLVNSGIPQNIGTSGANNPGNFPQASNLIELNIDYIVEETIEYVNATYPSLVYSEAKCRRDTKLILEGLVKDLKAGGRNATLINQGAYYSGAVSGQETQTEAAILNTKLIIANVLQNDSGSPYAGTGSVSQVFDNDYTAETDSAVNANNLIDCVAFAFDNAYNPPKENNKMDVFLCNDATIVRNITVQRHGGFMMVLDPEGQILTRSPYCQTGTSFAQSFGTKRAFNGGQYIDGYAANMPAQITNVTNPYKITVTSPSGQGLFIRRPPTPFPFVLSGARYQVNAIENYNQSTGTVDLIIDETSNSGNGYTGSTGVDIFIQSGGNRSMLSNDFTQVNDLGYGIVATNNALTEAVSMFTYYCHTGYIASTGSQIRSLGGNNSYGFYGLVAEGADPDEIPTAVNLRDDMVFSAKVINIEGYLEFNSAVPGGVTVGDTIEQQVTGASATVSALGEQGKRIYITDIIGEFNATDDVTTDDSATILQEPAAVVLENVSADAEKLFVYVYDCTGFPLNVSEVEILHPSGLYQPYEVTNAQQLEFKFGQYDGINDTIAATYAGSSPQSSKATFKITKSHLNGYQVDILTGGGGYAASETFVVAGNLLGGATPANDATITVDTVSSGSITGVSITGTSVKDDSTPVRDNRVYRLNLGTGIEGTASNGLQEITPHNTQCIIRHKQNFVLSNFPVVNPSTRPSTAFQFTDDTDLTYRTIAFGTTILAGYNTAPTERIVTFDSNFRYIDLTANNDYIATAENNGTFTVDPNYTDILGAVTPDAAKTFGSKVGDRFIIINPLDATNQARINSGEMIFAWGGKVHVIDAYSEYTFNPGTGVVTVAMIGISDKANTDINYPASAAGLGTSLTNSAGITLKGGLVAGEDAEITVNISTTRATGHDMLDIGTGGYNTSNYPDRIFGQPFGTSVVSTNDAIDSTGNASKAQVQERDKGRVFAVLTDQDGFFRVGRFFTVDQGTGSVTFNAALVLTNIDGIGFKRGVRVNEFSADDTFTDAKGDAVPTQTAVEGYINARLGLDRNGQPYTPKIGPGFLSLGGAGFSETPMQDVLNMGSNRLTNLALPITGSDGANKTYVDSKTDELNDIGDVTITGTGGGLSGQLLIFNGSAQSSENADVVGDIGFTRTAANELTASITAGVIINTDINDDAGIVQSKLAMQLTTAIAAAPTGTAEDKQAASGLASFDSANFEVTDGWVGIKDGGVSATELAGTLDFSGKSVTLQAGEISNGELANDGITIGSTDVSLGGTITALTGLTTINHTGNITGPANIGADNGVNIGANGNRYNTVWATVFNGQATEALYADLAENYLGDADYEPGTVVVFGGDAEVTVCTSKGQTSVAGVVTTNPAHLMNSALEGDNVVGLALQGRVPCKVIGTVKKGDMLVTSAVPGYAIVNNSPGVGEVLGKAVGTKDDDGHGVVEVVVGRV